MRLDLSPTDGTGVETVADVVRFEIQIGGVAVETADGTERYDGYEVYGGGE